MRFPLVGLSTSVLLSCTAQNPAYSDSSGSGSGSGKATTSSTTTLGASVTTAASDSSLQTSDDSQGPTSAEDGTTADTPLDAGHDTRCWSTPISIADVLPFGSRLTNVPVRIETSRLGPDLNADNLRFYQDGQLLAHEHEEPGRIVWVRVPEMMSGSDPQIEAVSGTACPDVRDSLQAAEVWTAGYVAVFHFDNGAGTPPVFTDSVTGITLSADPNTEVVESMSFLGSYADKSGDGALLASDPSLDLFGSQPLSILGWVRLEENEAGVLPWNGDLQARHRELLGKLPGYRLNAVRGQVDTNSTLQPRPFFNLSQLIPGPLQDNVFGTEPVPEAEWTMLAGTFDGTVAALYVNDALEGATTTQFIPGSEDTQVRVGRWLRGGIDEVRVSNVVRSHDWIRVQYASMTDTLLEYGAREPFDP